MAEPEPEALSNFSCAPRIVESAGALPDLVAAPTSSGQPGVASRRPRRPEVSILLLAGKVTAPVKVPPALGIMPKTVESMPSRSALSLVPQESEEAPTSGLVQP